MTCFRRWTLGSPASFLPLWHEGLLLYSLPLAKAVAAQGYELYGKSDLRFLQAVYGILRDVFNFQPKLPKEKFLKNGYAERKVILTLNILLMCQAKHKELTNSASHRNHFSRKYKIAGTSTGHSYSKRITQGEEKLEQPLVQCVEELNTGVLGCEKKVESSYKSSYYLHRGSHTEKSQGARKHLAFNYSSKTYRLGCTISDAMLFPLLQVTSHPIGKDMKTLYHIHHPSVLTFCPVLI